MTVPHTNDDHEPPTPPDDRPVDDSDNAPPEPEPRRGPGRPARVEFANMTERERLLVDQARREEKRKLYKDLETLTETRAELEKLKRQVLAQTPTTTVGADQQNAMLQRLEQMITSQNERFDRFEENQQKQRREADLRAYKAERLAELRQDGEDVIEALVGGDSEDAIDESIAIARAEYQFIAQKEAEKQKRQPPRAVTVQAQNGRPRGTPPVVTPNTVEAELDSETITEKTSDAAVRSGEYGKARTQLFSRLKRSYNYQGPRPTGRS